MDIDLNTCKPGDLLRLRNGWFVTYSEYQTGLPYPHLLRRFNGREYCVNNSGYSFCAAAPCMNDVIEIIGQ